MIRLLLVDDQPLIRAGLRRILEPQEELTIAGECEDGDQVLDAVARLHPDVVVMDIRMRRMAGAEATRRLRTLPDAPPVLALTTFDDEETVAAAIGAGASGFILKDAPGEDIVRAVTAIAGGNSWLDPQIAGQVIDAYRRGAGSQPHDRVLIAQLTERERDVLQHVGQGETNAEIVSEATGKTHLSNLLGKLELGDRAAAIVFAHVNGVV